MPQALPSVTQEEATILIQKIMDRFGPDDLNVVYDSDKCETASESYLGCYDPVSNTLYFPPGRIQTYVLAHEIAHAIERNYAGGHAGEKFSYMQGEGFARAFESNWMLTEGKIADWSCEKCGGIKAHLMPDNSITCSGCQSNYYITTYDPKDFRNAPPQTGMVY